MQFEINDDRYELLQITPDEEPGEIGYDIYKNGGDEPINLGEIAYFDGEPTKQDLIELLNRRK